MAKRLITVTSEPIWKPISKGIVFFATTGLMFTELNGFAEISFSVKPCRTWRSIVSIVRYEPLIILDGVLLHVWLTKTEFGVSSVITILIRVSMLLGIWMLSNGCVEETSEWCRRGALTFVVDGAFFLGSRINRYHVAKQCRSQA